MLLPLIKKETNKQIAIQEDACGSEEAGMLRKWLTGWKFCYEIKTVSIL